MKRRLSFGLIVLVVTGLAIVGIVSRAPVGHTYAAASTPPPPTATVPPPPPPPVIATSTPAPTATALPTATPTSPPPTPTPTPKPSPTKAPKPTATPTSPPPLVPTPIPTAKIVPTTGAGGTARLPGSRTTVSRSSAPVNSAPAPASLPRTGGGDGGPASPLLPLALAGVTVLGAVLRRISRKP